MNIIPKERITGLFESTELKIDGARYKIFPNGKSDSSGGNQHGLRIKVTTKNTRGALSIAINPENGSIDYDNIHKGEEFKGAQLTKVIDNVGGLAVYSLKELIDVYNNVSPETVDAFKKKADEYNKLSPKERKPYIKMSKGDI